MIRFSCECGQQLQARDEHAGKAVICPSCQRRATVPRSSATAIQPEEPVEQAPPRSRVKRERPVLRDGNEPRTEEEARPRRRAGGSSGKALASLVLGILSFCGCSCLTGLPAIALGIWSLLDIGKAAGTLTGKPLAWIGIFLSTLGTLCLPIGYYFAGQAAILRVREAGNSQISMNNLKQIGLAMHNYHDTYGSFPSANFNPTRFGQPRGPGQDKPHLSWRVALLPFLEQGNLYTQFNLNEPWDGPTNKKLLDKMPAVYKVPGDDKTPANQTRYQVFSGNGAAFDPMRGLRFVDFTDGTSNTLLVVEAAQPVPWTKPEDIPFDPNKPIKPLLSTQFQSGFHVVTADSFARTLPPDISENTLKAMITRNAGDIFNWP